MSSFLTLVGRSLLEHERRAFGTVLRDVSLGREAVEILNDLAAYEQRTNPADRLSQSALRLVGLEVLRRLLPLVVEDGKRIAIEQALVAARGLATTRASTASPHIAVLVDAGLDRDLRRDERIARALRPVLKRRFLQTVDKVARDDAVASLASARQVFHGIAAYPYTPGAAFFTSMDTEQVVKALGLRLARSMTGFIVSGTARSALERMSRQPYLQVQTVSQLAARYAALRSANLVTSITDQQRASIRTVLGQVYANPYIGQVEARDRIVESIGLRPDQLVSLGNYRGQLSRQGVSRLRQGKLIASYVQRLLVQRADLIARTETISALNNGKLALWIAARQSGTLGSDTRKRWVTHKDERTCPICRPLDGKTADITEPFIVMDREIQAPPAHPRCRCTLSLDHGRRRVEILSG